MLVEKLADDFARNEGELNENLEKLTGEERAVDRDSQGDSYVAHSLLREDVVPEHYISDTETVVSPKPVEK
ncbi:hypothetical protein A2U01_0088660, partial [Trifolium medium]|nr:hypothetical protein [Trifolium medium]